jgi:hypothetical protein
MLVALPDFIGFHPFHLENARIPFDRNDMFADWAFYLRAN